MILHLLRTRCLLGSLFWAQTWHAFYPEPAYGLAAELHITGGK